MSAFRLIAFSALFLLSFGIVGGCGDTNIIIDETFPTDDGGGGSGNPAVCQIPPLNTNFSNEIYFFLDSNNGFVIGATSTGSIVTITVTTSPGNFTRTFRGSTFGEDVDDACDIFREIFADGDQQAAGLCGRSLNGSIFTLFVDNNDPSFLNIRGECFTVVSTLLVTSDMNLEADRVFNDMVDTGALDPSYNPIPEIIEELIQ